MTAPPPSYYLDLESRLVKDNILHLDAWDMVSLKVAFTSKSWDDTLAVVRSCLKSVNFRCHVHDKYKAVLEPRCTESWPEGCPQCWVYYHSERIMDSVKSQSSI